MNKKGYRNHHFLVADFNGNASDVSLFIRIYLTRTYLLSISHVVIALGTGYIAMK